MGTRQQMGTRQHRPLIGPVICAAGALTGAAVERAGGIIMAVVGMLTGVLAAVAAARMSRRALLLGIRTCVTSWMGVSNMAQLSSKGWKRWARGKGRPALQAHRVDRVEGTDRALQGGGRIKCQQTQGQPGRWTSVHVDAPLCMCAAHA
jgi:hypothetical protein